MRACERLAQSCYQVKQPRGENLVTARYRKRAAIANGRYCHVMYKLLYPIALGSGQSLMYRLGSWLGLVLVLVCA